MNLEKSKYLILSILGFLFIFLLIVTILYYTQPRLVPGEPLTCKTIIQNGEPSKKIDIVFFFDNINEEIAQEYINYLLDIVPFKDNKGKFNFYSVNAAPDCSIQSGILVCYSRSLVQAAALCPDDYIVVLSKQTSSIRSSAYINLISVNTENPKSVVIHEFAHIFANLADEYIPSVIPRGSKNCVSSCDKFKSETDGCYQGCSQDSYLRSVDSGVMRTLRTNNYGKFDTEILNENLDKYE